MYGEDLILVADDYETPDGRIVQGTRKTRIRGCVVTPRGQSSTEGGDVWDGDTRSMQVIAPAGTKVENGRTVIFRGEEYEVAHTSYDYAPVRRPVIARHRAGTVFIIERKEG